MKNLIIILIAALMLTGCAGTGTRLIMDYPMPDGQVMHIEATGDVLVTYNPETGNVEFVTEAIKKETAELITEQMKQLWSLLGS